MSQATLKSCCAAAYESEIARWLLGESFHPGGLALTRVLGEQLRLAADVHVLDLASGRGESALRLAEWFACTVTGIDLGSENVEAAREAARLARLEHRVSFVAGDAEKLPFEDGTFDAVICECAFCLFPNKSTAAHEIARVLRPGGLLGLADLVREDPLPPSLDSVVSWLACMGDAQTVPIYVSALAEAGLHATSVERHDGALVEIVGRARERLFTAEILVGLGKLSWPTVDFAAARTLARDANTAIAAGKLGYILAVAQRSG